MAEENTEELPSVDELMQRIAENYESLPRQLKSVATYIEQHRGSVMVDRTSDIATSCGVHPSAVVRFAQRFGFSGFSDLQAVFRQAYTGQGASSSEPSSSSRPSRHAATNSRATLPPDSRPGFSSINLRMRC